jgi:hypothetical protein
MSEVAIFTRIDPRADQLPAAALQTAPVAAEGSSSVVEWRALFEVPRGELCLAPQRTDGSA